MSFIITKKKKWRYWGGGTGATRQWIGSHQLSIVSHLSCSLAFCVPSQFSSCHPLHFAIQAPSITLFLIGFFFPPVPIYTSFLDSLPGDFSHFPRLTCWERKREREVTVAVQSLPFCVIRLQYRLWHRLETYRSGRGLKLRQLMIKQTCLR